MFSFEFFEPDASIPMMMVIPDMADGYNGADTDNHPGNPKGTDTVPAWLTPGENVVNAEASRIPGNQEMIDEMNDEGRAIQEAQGGPIPTYQDDGGIIQGVTDFFTMPTPPPGSGIKYRRHKNGAIGIWAGNTFRGYYKEPAKKESSFSERLGISYNAKGSTVPAYAAGGMEIPRPDGMLNSLGNRLKDRDGGPMYANTGMYTPSTAELYGLYGTETSYGKNIVNRPGDGVGPYQIKGATAISPGFGINSLFPELNAAVNDGTYSNANEAYLANKDMVDSVLMDGTQVEPFVLNYLDRAENELGDRNKAILSFNQGIPGTRNFKGNAVDTDYVSKVLANQVGFKPQVKEVPQLVAGVPQTVNKDGTVTIDLGEMKMEEPTAMSAMAAPGGGSSATPPPVNNNAPPTVEDQGEVGVNDTIIRNGVPYTYDAKKDAYIDKEGREYSRSIGEFFSDLIPDVNTLYPTLESQLQEGDVEVGTYEGQPVYKDKEGDFVYIEKNEPVFGKPSYRRIKMNKYGVPLLAAEDDIVFNDPANRTTVPKPKDPNQLIPLPGVSDEPDEKKAEEALKQTPPVKKKTFLDDAQSWLTTDVFPWVKENFGSMIDDKLIARMITLYAGSRALGYDHTGSARYAAKDYLKQLDAKGSAGIKKLGGKIYHTRLGVLPTVIGSDGYERVSIKGVPLRLDDPRVAPYLEPHNENIHDIMKLTSSFQSDAKNKIDGINQTIEERKDRVPLSLASTLAQESRTLFAKERTRFGGLSTEQQSEVIRQMSLAADDFFKAYQLHLDDDDNDKPQSLEAFYNNRMLVLNTDSAISFTDTTGTSAKNMAKLDKQISNDAIASFPDNGKAAAAKYKADWKKYKTTWQAYTQLVEDGKARANFIGQGDNKGYNDFMNWVKECKKSNPDALAVFKIVKQANNQ